MEFGGCDDWEFEREFERMELDDGELEPVYRRMVEFERMELDVGELEPVYRRLVEFDGRDDRGSLRGWSWMLGSLSLFVGWSLWSLMVGSCARGCRACSVGVEGLVRGWC